MAGRYSVESIFKAVDRVTAPVSRMQNQVGKFTRSMERGLKTVNRAVDSTISGIKRAGGAVVKYGAIGIGAVTTGVTLLIREFSKVEDAEAAFTPLLGGADRARQMVEALNETAASTPFQFENLADAANQLLPTMNGNIERTIKTMRMLGDTAGGNAQKLDSITRGFTKAMLKGKVDMESLNMIAEAGVPIFTELADSMGKKVGPAFFKMISAGRVTTQDLTKAFEKMTGEGGKFYQGMGIASRTTSGLWSTLKDNISLTAAELGSVLAPVIKDLIKDATGIAQRVREWVKTNRELISVKFLEFVDATKRAFLSLLDALTWLNEHKETIGKVAASIVALVLILKGLAAVMMVVNLVTMANPIGLIAVSIAAMIAVIAAAIVWWDDLKAAFLGLPGPVKAALAVIAGPIGWLIGAAALIYENWEPIKGFFADLWDGVVETFNAAVDRIMAVVDEVRSVVSSVMSTASSIGGSLAGFFGFGNTGGGAGAQDERQMVSPQDRVARTIEEQRTTSTAEVTIRDETGRAEVTSGVLGPGLLLQPTGAF